MPYIPPRPGSHGDLCIHTGSRTLVREHLFLYEKPRFVQYISKIMHKYKGSKLYTMYTFDGVCKTLQKQGRIVSIVALYYAII